MSEFTKMKFFDDDVGLSYDDVLIVPERSDIKSRTDVDLSCHVSPNITLKYPVMSAAMDTVTNGDMAVRLGELGAMGIIHRFQSVYKRYDEAMRCLSKNLPVGVAVGLKDTIEECKHLSDVVDILAVDVAHAHHDDVIEFVKKLDGAINNNTAIMIGNIVTSFAAREFIEAGADMLKVGIGGGAACSTRVVTGFGVPNLTAIMYVKQGVYQASHGKLVTIVADGGIRNSADIAKAIAAGADCVMLGSLFAGTDEAPGDELNGMKLFRGMSSDSARIAYRGIKPGTVAEGVSAMMPCKGPVHDVLDGLMGGLRSALTYGGAHDLSELYTNTSFIRVTNASVHTSRPHVLEGHGVVQKDRYRKGD